MQTSILHPVDRAVLEERIADILADEGLDIGNDAAATSAAERVVLEVLVPALEAASAPQRPARAIKHSFTAAHARVLFLLADKATEGLTDTQLYRRYQTKVARAGAPWPYISEAGIRSRRAELVAWGLVSHTGAWGTTPNNRRCRVWAATDGPLLVDRVPREPGLASVLDALAAEAGTDLVLLSTVKRIRLEVLA